MKSPLETYTANRLSEEGIVFEYEPYSFIIFPSFTHSFVCIEKPGKEFKKISSNVRPITYTPDFIGDGWIIETKGFRTPEFDLRWKLFKYLLKDRSDILILMPKRQKDVEKAIELIKQHGKNTRILQFPEGIIHPPKDTTQPKTTEAKKREPRNGGPRQGALPRRRSSRLPPNKS